MVDPASVLILVAEVAVALAGFASIVSVFVHPDRAEMEDVDRFRLFALLSTAFNALLIALFALGLLSADVSPATTWRAASAANIASGVPFLIKGWHDARPLLAGSQRILTVTFGYPMIGSCVVVLALQAVNVVVLHSFWPLYCSLGLNILIASATFARLLFRRPAA